MADGDPAVSRFWILQANRLFGLVLVLLGAMILAGKIDQEPVVGMVAIWVGLLVFFLVPMAFARRWKRDR